MRRLILWYLLLLFLAACLPGNRFASTDSPTDSATQTLSAAIPTSKPLRSLLTTPSPTFPPTKASPISPEISPAVTPPPNPFPEWPFAVGIRWVYVSEVYSGDAKAKYRVVDTVTSVFSNGVSFSATLERQAEFLEGDITVDYRGSFDPGTSTIVIDDSFVSNNKSLILKFPLDDGLNWSHDVKEETGEKEQVIGNNVWLSGPITRQLITENRSNCYEILYQYLSGGINSWFCSGIGMVEHVYKHNGTPFGYHEILVDYEVK